MIIISSNSYIIHKDADDYIPFQLINIRAKMRPNTDSWNVVGLIFQNNLRWNKRIFPLPLWLPKSEAL